MTPVSGGGEGHREGSCWEYRYGGGRLWSLAPGPSLALHGPGLSFPSESKVDSSPWRAWAPSCSLVMPQALAQCQSPVQC